MAKIVELIFTKEKVGSGVEEDPFRVVDQWYNKDGSLVFEIDTWKAQQDIKEENLNSPQQTQPSIPLDVVKKLILSWVGPNAEKEISKLLNEYVEQQANA